MIDIRMKGIYCPNCKNKEEYYAEISSFIDYYGVEKIRFRCEGCQSDFYFSLVQIEKDVEA